MKRNTLKGKKAMTAIFIEDSFDSAHWLPSVPEGHKCSRMHGHTYRIRLEVTGEVGAETGWIVDYTDIKAEWSAVKSQLDHHLLNDLMPNPTCELIAAWIGARMPSVSKIELRETVNCGVVWVA